MHNAKTTLGQLIDRAMEMERLAYDFYEALEKKYENNTDFVRCLSEIKEDERQHLRVLNEIRQSLSEVRLETKVTIDAMHRLTDVVAFLKHLDVAELETTDDVCDAIRKLEAVEFDVVMGFVGLEEIDFEFTREYLANETVEHGQKIFRAQQCLL